MALISLSTFSQRLAPPFVHRVPLIVSRCRERTPARITPQNYVGYKEGGELTNFVRSAEERRGKKLTGVSHTSCVILLDEVDRAADGLMTFLMNFLDQGQLTSGAGEMVDARKAVVLMTTNVGRTAIAAVRKAADGGAAADGGGATMQRKRAEIVESVRQDVLAHVCEGRYENLGRLGTIVPFLPLNAQGRRGIISRQLQDVDRRLREGQAPASLSGWSESCVEMIASQWDEDLGGRSTRDYIEEHVVELMADALDSAPPDVLAGLAPPLQLWLDVTAGSEDTAGHAPGSASGSASGAASSARLVCHPWRGESSYTSSRSVTMGAAEDDGDDEPGWDDARYEWATPATHNR